jgi:ribosome recycling factor
MEDKLLQLNEELASTAQHFKEEVGGIRSNRPTPKLVEDIKVDYFGQQMSIKQLASISVVPPRELQISAWDAQSAPLIGKAIEAANIGVTANVQGSLIRINLPPLSDERRQELIKLIKNISEEHRIRVRSLREKYNKLVKQAEDDKEVDKDQRFHFQEKIQNAVKKSNKDIEEMLENKVKEIQE